MTGRFIIPDGFPCMPPTQSQVQTSVENSLDRLLDEDRKLLVDNANERSISHRLAVYLEQEAAEFEIDYDIDVEYNRVVTENGTPGDFIKEVLYGQLSEECQGRRRIRDDDTDAQTVFPDIIIHRRGSSEHNLLVIELKKTSSSRSGKCDKEKIERYHTDLGYENGLFLRLGVGEDPCIDTWDWSSR